MQQNKTYIIYSVSTLGNISGLDWKEIIEIGAYKICFDGDKTKILGEFHTLIHPIGHQYNRRTTRYLHIHENELSQAPYYPEVIEEFIRWGGLDAVYVAWKSETVGVLMKNNDAFQIDDFPHLRFMSLDEEFSRFEGAEYTVSLREAMSRLAITFYGSKFSPMAQSYNMIGVMQVLWGVHIGTSRPENQNTETVIDVEFHEVQTENRQKPRAYSTYQEQSPRHMKGNSSLFPEWTEGDAIKQLRKERAQRQQYSFC